MRLRKTNLDDLPQLKALWALGFGDTEQEIEAFFAISYPAATGFCAEEDGRLIAAAYALPQELAWGERTAKAAYLYAVTTHPDFRKQGVCRKLLAFAEKELKKRYFDCLILVPATDALRAYYETMGFCTQKSDFLDDGPAPEARGVCEELTPVDYAGLRETILYDTPHVRYTLADLRYQASMSGFYRLEPLRLRLRARKRRYARRGRDPAGRLCAARAFKKDSGCQLPSAHGRRQCALCHVQMAFGGEKTAGCLSGL